MLTDIVEVRPAGGYRLFVRFEDGVAGEVDLEPILRFDGVFAPLRDRLQGFVPFRALPVLPQFVAVQGRPFGDEAQHARRETPLDHGQGLDGDDGLLPPVAHMEMGRRMVIIKHGDDNAKESRKLRHRRGVFGRGGMRAKRLSRGRARLSD